MATVLNRTTKQFLASVNTPDFPTGSWIHEPDMTAVVGFGSQYWIITGDVVTLMDQAARDAVDAQQLSDNRDGTSDRIDPVESYERTNVKMIIRELNLLRAAVTTLSTQTNAVDGSIDVQNMPDRTIAQYKTQFRAEMDGS